MLKVGELIDKTINLAIKIQETSETKSLRDFESNFENYINVLDELEKEVNDFALNFEYVDNFEI